MEQMIANMAGTHVAKDNRPKGRPQPQRPTFPENDEGLGFLCGAAFARPLPVDAAVATT